MGSEKVIRAVRCALAGTAAAALLVAYPAAAQPSASDRETARAAMSDARDLRDKGDLKGALQRFKAADAIMHVPSTGYEVARTQVDLGRLLEARDTIAAIRKEPSSPNDPAPFVEARTKADELDAQIETKIPSLTITVGGAADGDTPVISVDGVSIPPAAAGLPRRVNPGHHVVTAKSTSSGEASQEVDLAEGEKKQIQLVLSGQASSPAPPLGGSNDQGAPSPPSPSEAPAADNGTSAGATVHSPSAITYAGGSVGAIGLIVGAVTGVMSISTTSKLSSECTSKVCSSSSAQSDYSSAHTTATLANVGFGVGVAGAAVAVVSLIVGHSGSPTATPSRAPTETETGGSGDAPADSSSPPPPESRLRVTPWIGLGGAGVLGTF